jgi:hypothetical protein
MSTRNARFQRGSGSYPCAVCGRQTRHTGVQGGDSELCPQCWELAGYENQLSDNGHESFDQSEAITVHGLIQELEARGGSAEAVQEARTVFAEVLEAI